MQTFARHRAWLAAPHAEAEVDHEHDRVLVTCYPALADTDLDLGAGFSAGFHGPPRDRLLTVLVLDGVRRWHRSDDPGAMTARHLTGPVIGAVVSDLVRPTSGRIVEINLGIEDGEELATRWTSFLA